CSRERLGYITDQWGSSHSSPGDKKIWGRASGRGAMSIMQSLFGGGSQDLVGLDISSSAVKLLELSRRGDRFHVETYAVEPLPANAVNEKQISDPKLVAESIVRAVNRAGTRTKNAALAVAGASVITKIVQMSSA